jgi:cysteinyl-tRNA synthetase
LEPDVWIRATQTIKNQIELIKILEKKGFTYIIEDGVYFDTSKLKKYGRLWPKKMKILPGARVEMVPQKKNPTDFALWKFAKGRKEMVWNSPWGKGFPGWHTECVVMSMKELGIPFDIHCGGIDHILIHHTNEIAQAEAAFSKILAKYWLHGEFLLVEGKKMAKSLGNIYTIEDLIKKGFNPISYRYLCLSAHYRSRLNFTFEALKSAQNALENLYEKLREMKLTKNKQKKGSNEKKYMKEFLKYINDDLDIPKALALMWDLIGDQKISDKEKYKLLLSFDKVFGLGLEKVKKIKIPRKIKELVKIREEYRKKMEFDKADKIREKIKEMGYWIEDTKEGPRIIKRLT